MCPATGNAIKRNDMDPYFVVRQFEEELCKYTGAKYAVTTTSCTMALLLACEWHLRRWDRRQVEIPKRTYISVPMSIIHAGGEPVFRDQAWKGLYQLKPLPVWDSARWFTKGMYRSHKTDISGDSLEETTIPNDYGGHMQCVSFHWTKILAIGQGGAILHDNDEADEWFRRARFDGRKEGVAPKDDVFPFVGWHCYMSPRDAAEGLSRLAVLPEFNAPLPNDDYPDLSKFWRFSNE